MKCKLATLHMRYWKLANTAKFKQLTALDSDIKMASTLDSKVVLHLFVAN